jgi:hypothetical protein
LGIRCKVRGWWFIFHQTNIESKCNLETLKKSKGEKKKKKTNNPLTLSFLGRGCNYCDQKGVVHFTPPSVNLVPMRGELKKNRKKKLDKGKE